MATLDSLTSNICQDMDLKHFPVDDFSIGITAPPFHPNCRSCICPYFDDEFTEGEMRSARDEDGEIYRVPGDMNYKEWEQKFLKNGDKSDLTKIEKNDMMINMQENIFKANKKVDTKMNDDELFINNQTKLITVKENSNVARQFINSKSFHDNFEDLTKSKIVNEALYQQAMEILEHRDGTDFEDLVAIDSRTGEIIAKNNLSEKAGTVGFSREQFESCVNNSNEIILLHNHPNSSRPSFADIRTLFENDMILASVVVCHDGSVYILHSPKRAFDIKDIWNTAYITYKQLLGDSQTAEIKATSSIYKKKLFIVEERKDYYE